MQIPILDTFVTPTGQSVRYIDHITNTLARSKIVLVVAGTGSGKTITIPTHLSTIHRRVAITQPTIVLVREKCGEIANLPGFKLGKNVGMQTGEYVVRTERGVVFMTDALLLAQLRTWTDAQIIKHYGAIIIDEVHKRSATIDTLLFFTRELVRRNPETAPNIILMSATVDPAIYEAYMSLVTVTVPGSTPYPVERRYEPVDDYMLALPQKIQDLVHQSAGNILVFLPKIAQIRKLIETLEAIPTVATSHVLVEVSSNTKQALKADKKTIFLGTPVVEVGLTLPNLTHVIDTGVEFSVAYNPLYDYAVMLTKPISYAQTLQRIGRCGRKLPGTAVLLYSKETHDTMRAEADPEIISSDITSMILALYTTDLNKEFWDNIRANLDVFWSFYSPTYKISQIDMIQNPSSDGIRCAMAKLYLTGMYSPFTGLTKLGALASRFNTNVHNIRMLFAGIYYGANIYDIATIASALDTNTYPPRKTPDNLIADDADDCQILIAHFDKLLECESIEQYVEFAETNKLQISGIQKWVDARDELLYIMRTFGFQLRRRPPLKELRRVPVEYADHMRRIRLAVYDAFKHNIVYVAHPKGGRLLRNGDNITYTGVARLPEAGTHIVALGAAIKEIAFGNVVFKCTASIISRIPDDFSPDLTFCTS